MKRLHLLELGRTTNLVFRSMSTGDFVWPFLTALGPFFDPFFQASVLPGAARVLAYHRV